VASCCILASALVRPPQFPVGNIESADPGMMVRVRCQPFSAPGHNPRSSDVYPGTVPGPGTRLLSPRSGVAAVPYSCPDTQQSQYSVSSV
jgi:hypothetical protein